MTKRKGRIHSLESFGTVDGPGIRFVIFFQGCPMRCRYCHNPDTWSVQGGMEMTAEEILAHYEKNRQFYRDGGITVTGGEPLMQLDFLTELMEKARKNGIHTCLDTSGIVYRKDEAAAYTRLFRSLNLVLLDLKHSDPGGHKKLTGCRQEPVLAFLEALESENVPVVIRHVVVPGITDGEEQLERLGWLMGGYSNIKGLEVLPYHTMGIEKYRKLEISYPLEGVESLSKEAAGSARQKILQGIRRRRKST